jgi:hypothetical protein
MCINLQFSISINKNKSEVENYRTALDGQDGCCSPSNVVSRSILGLYGLPLLRPDCCQLLRRLPCQVAFTKSNCPRSSSRLRRSPAPDQTPDPNVHQIQLQIQTFTSSRSTSRSSSTSRRSRPPDTALAPGVHVHQVQFQIQTFETRILTQFYFRDSN